MSGKYLYVGRCVEPDVWTDIYTNKSGKIVGAIRQANTGQGYAINAIRYNFTTRLQFNAFRREVVLPIMQERHARMVAAGHMTAEQAAENEHQLMDVTLDAKTGEPVDA